MFSIVSKYLAVSPSRLASSPIQWGNTDRVRELMGRVDEIFFERDTVYYPILSPNHYWKEMITKSGSMLQLIQNLQNDNKTDKIDALRSEYLRAIEPYIIDNMVRLGYLITIIKK